MDVASNTQDLARLIGSLYEAAFSPDLLTGLAPKIAEVFGSSSTVLKTYRADSEVDLLESTDNMLLGARDQGLAEYWHRNDLWVQRSEAFGPGRVIVGHDLTPPEELEETGYYRDWLRRLSIYHVVGGVFRLDEGGLGVLGVHRDRDGAFYGEGEREIAALLLPHLERALRLRQRLAPAAAAAALATLEGAGSALLIVSGAHRRILFANAAAERLLARTPELSAAAGRLRARDPHTDARLAAAVAAACATAAGRGAMRPSALQALRAERSPLILVASPLPESLAPAGEPAALVELRDPDVASPPADLLREVFGFTPAEASVAAALSCGRAIPDIARQLGVGQSTVKSQLKSIMAKTQTRRQAELVALLHASLGRLGGLFPRLGDEGGAGRA